MKLEMVQKNIQKEKHLKIIRKMRRKILVLCLIGLISCKKSESFAQENKLVLTKKNIEMNSHIKDILEKQVLSGYAVKENGLDEVSEYQYSIEDYQAAAYISVEILKKNGVKILDNGAFKRKINHIFKYKGSEQVINYLIEYNCPREEKVFQLDENIIISNSNPFFIDKNYNILTEAYFLPFLIDYKKDFPKLYVKEDKDIIQEEKDRKTIKWKDLPNLSELQHMHQQKLIHRNKYLFNDDRASFVWLRSNDTWFLESLVKTFGYVEDKALLDFVLKRNYKDLAELEKILISRSCGGKNRLNTEVFAVVKGWKKKELSDFSFRIQELMYTLIKKEEQGKSEIDFPELTKILSETAYHMSKTDEDSYYNFFLILNLTEKYREEIEKKNFYNNPDLKRVWDETKTGGRWRPGMEEASLKRETLETITLYPRPDFSSTPKQLEISSEDIEYLHKVSDWDFVRVPHMVGYLAPKNSKKYSFLAEEDFTPKEEKGFWDKLFG